MSWLILVLISILSGSTVGLLQRILLKEEQSDPVAYAFVFQILVAIMFFIYSLFTEFSLPSLIFLFPYLIAMSLFYALANLTLFKSFQTIEVSEVAVITASKSMWTVISASMVLKEIINMERLAGTLLVIFGVIIISRKHKQLKFSKGHLYALLAAIFFGLGFTNDAFLLNHFNVQSYMTLAFLLPSIVILCFRPKSIKKIRLFIDKKRLLKMLGASFFYGLSALTIGLAYKAGGNASQISPIGQSSIVFTVALAYIFLKERDNMVKKIVGALLVFSGVLFLK